MLRFVATLLVLAATGLSSACTATADTPTPTPAPPDASKPIAPGTFPDMSSYTTVSPDDYMWQTDNPGRPYKLTNYGFTTPDGVQCGFGQIPLASCAGNNLPAVPPAKCDPAQRAFGDNEISTNGDLRQVSDTGCANTASSKVLPPFHTLTVYGVTCGVDDRGTTACKDPQGRGFVLSPSWSGWIPKV